VQEAALAQAQTNLPPLQKALTVQEDLLAYLIGKAPGQGAPPLFTMADFTLPKSLPLSLPSKLVEQRPDIRVAEANLHVASAAVGVAVAARLPTLALEAAGGGNGARFATLFSRGDNFWSYGVSVAQPLFEGGQLLHKERSAKAALVQAQELYRSAVLAAFQNVADALQALDVDNRALGFAEASQKAAASSLDIAQKQQQAGQIAGVTVLTAEQALRAADVTLVGAQAARLTDTAALFQALGGGWWGDSSGRS
jgi:NodT family efflux transporter outer membrane factor (OMF) lipoprotein